MRVPIRLLLAALFTIVVPAVATAQSWLDAYKTGDYRTAAALLHPLVMDLAPDEIFPDANAAEHLALMYARGLGVPADAVLACSLFDIADRAVQSQGPVPHDLEGLRAQQERLAQFTERRETQCDSLGQPERMEASSLLGCFTADFPTQHFELAVGHTVDVKRSGVLVRYGKKESVETLFVDDCPAEVLLVRYTRAEAPDPTTAARHFIEVFAWSRVTRRQGRPGRALIWTLREVVGSHTAFRAVERLIEDGPTAWPTPPLSFALADVTLQMTPSGEVTWRFDSGGDRHGVVERTSRARAAAASQVTTGTGAVQIRVLDHVGAPRGGATVRLAGRTTREGETKDDGMVMFDGLPAGRYDVLASANGEVLSPMPFVDVTTGPAPPLDVTLAPAGRLSAILACGVTPPATLRGFFDDADAVLHVKVEGQRAFDGTDGNGGTRIMTMNDVLVLHAFKGAPRSDSGGLVNVLQIGGAIERGGVVDQLQFNHLNPLSIGDDYILFLKRQPDGALMIHFAEAGAFRLRNGVVEPLGDGALAAEWKNARSSEFLEKLSAATSRP